MRVSSFRRTRAHGTRDGIQTVNRFRRFLAAQNVGTGRLSTAGLALGYFVTGAVLYLVSLYSLSANGGRHPLWLHLLVLGAVCALMLLRTRAPRTALCLALVPVAVDALVGPTIPVWIAVGDLLYAASLYSSRKFADAILLWSNGLTLPIGIGTAVLARDWRVGVLVAGALALFVLVPLWWATTVRGHRDAADLERARSRALAQLAEVDRQTAVRQERSRLARDLHDVVAGHLSAIAIQSEAALGALSKDPSAVEAVLKSVRNNSIDALTEMRSMIGLLRSEQSVDAPRTAYRMKDLSRLVDSARLSGSRIEVTGELGVMPAAVDITAYRIVTEAVTNAITHAPGQLIGVDLTRGRSAVVIRINNCIPPGCAGNTPPAGRGFGIANMHQRAETLGGTVDTGVRPGPGGPQWLVRAELPLNTKEPA